MTSGSIAYNTIIIKLERSDSRFKWNYLIKNLIILDRATEEEIFIYDISNLDLEFLSTYSCPNKKDSKLAQYKMFCLSVRLDGMQLDRLVRSYFEYIREKAVYYSQKNLISALKVNDRSYLNGLELPELMKEFNSISKLLEMTFKV